MKQLFKSGASFFKNLLSSTSDLSSMRFFRLLVGILFSLDWIYTRLAEHKAFAPGWEMLAFIASVFGLSMFQKSMETRSYPYNNYNQTATIYEENNPVVQYEQTPTVNPNNL